MTADDFAAQMKVITPGREILIAKGADLIVDELIGHYQISLRPNAVLMGYKITPLFTELFSKYDLTKLRIAGISFFDQPVFEDHRWFFGNENGERIFIDPDTQEIRVEESPATDELPGLYLEWSFAKDFDHFMAALLVVAEYRSKYTADTPREIRLDYAIRASRAAGGKQYTMFLAYIADDDDDVYEQALGAS
jgi:hypothetical protein